jgi:hypothetical protein
MEAQGFAEVNMSLDDEKRLVQQLSKDLSPEVANSVKEITKSPKMQAAMLSDMEKAMALSAFRINSIVNNESMSLDVREREVKSEIEGLQKSIFETGLKYAMDGSAAPEKRDVGPRNMVLLSGKVFRAGIVDFVLSAFSSSAFHLSKGKASREKSAAAASAFTARVAVRLGMKPAGFLSSVVKKK